MYTSFKGGSLYSYIKKHGMKKFPLNIVGPDDRRRIAGNIKALWRRTGLTKKEASLRICLHPATLSKLILCDRLPRVETMERIAEFFKVDAGLIVDSVIEDIEQEKPTKNGPPSPLHAFWSANLSTNYILYRRCFLAVAYGLNPCIVEDLYHDMLVSILERPPLTWDQEISERGPEYVMENEYTALIRFLAKNTVHSHFREERRPKRKHISVELNHFSHAIPEINYDVLGSINAARILEHLRTVLPPQYFLFFCLDSMGYTPTQIKDITGASSVDSAKSKLYRARAKVRDTFDYDEWV